MNSVTFLIILEALNIVIVVNSFIFIEKCIMSKINYLQDCFYNLRVEQVRNSCLIEEIMNDKTNKEEK